MARDPLEAQVEALERRRAVRLNHNKPTWSPLTLLDDGQRAWVERFRASPPLSSTVWEIGRQRGKSFTALAESWDFLASTPMAISRYCALTKDSAVSISAPILATIRQECPKAQRPRMSSAMDEEGMQQARVLTWPNGSTMWVFGTDAQSFRKGRGPRSDRILLEESAFYQNLPEVEAALMASLQTTGGKALYFSSPPVAPGHAFAARVRTARGTGRFEHDTFWSNPRIDHEAVIRFECERLGMTRDELLASTYFRREYLAEEVTEETRAALPAWPSVEKECTVDRLRPQHFDGYASFDWGGVTGDPHASLWGVFDFAAQHLHIEAEYERRGATVEQVVTDLKKAETEVWGVNKWDGTLLGAGEFERQYKTLPEWLRGAVSEKAPRQPYLRTCDTNQEQLQQELLVRHGYVMLPWEKPDKHLRVDHLNNFVRRKQLSISPRCKRLLEQMHTTVWDEKRKTWVRTAKDHGDLIDCAPAGTMVMTEDGERPIESIRVGDKVWTRKGLRPVTAAKRTKREAELWRVDASNGAAVYATSEHPFYVEGEWVPLHQLTVSSILTTWTNRSTSNGTAEGGSGTRNPSGAITACTTYIRSGIRRNISTALNGLRSMGRFLLGWWCTMSTAIRSTTMFPTSAFSLAPSTSAGTWTKSEGPPPRGTWSTQSMPLGRGTPAKPGGSGTAETPRPCGKISRFANMFARFAKRFSSPTARAEPSRAVPPVVRVSSVRNTGIIAPVYNLQVDDEPEYFANGILVHNCLVGMVWHLHIHRDCRPVVDLYLTNEPPKRVGWETLSGVNRRIRRY